MSSPSLVPPLPDRRRDRQPEHVLQRSIRDFATGNHIDEIAALLRGMMADPVQLVRAMGVSGSVERASEIADVALQLGLPGELTARLRCLAVESRIVGGSAPEALRVAEDVVAASGAVPDSVSAATAASRTFGRYFIDTAEGRRYAETLLLAGGGRIDAELLAAAAVLSEAVLSEGRLSDGLTLARDAAKGAHALPSPLWRPYLHLVLADRLTDCGAYEETEDALRMARRAMAGKDGTRTEGAGVAIAMKYQNARLLSHRGRLTEARDEAQQALLAAVGVGARLFVPLLLALLGQLALWSGDAEEAASLVARCRDVLAQAHVYLPSIGYAWTEIQVSAAWQGPAAALRRMVTDYGSNTGRSALFVRQPEAAAWFVRIALRAGDRAWAVTAVETAQRLADDNPGMPTLAVAALHANSLLHRDADGLVRAASGHRHHQARLTAAEDLASVLNDSAVPASGHGPGDGLSGSGPQADDAVALSDAEREVAHLVGKGLTNRQVALRTGRSQHTVNFHLRNIFRKLGLSSRVELAGRVHTWAAHPPERHLTRGASARGVTDRSGDGSGEGREATACSLGLCSTAAG
ncbi:helix-turn-helix transcriptional regulator [Streptomyces sp. NPDC047002]|uniref:helix-turn-helix transcriptional regulator n=1 Tax=Streptomyces sp. NPDC047002 TaxID=3155475 RepID=UPI00345158BB